MGEVTKLFSARTDIRTATDSEKNDFLELLNRFSHAMNVSDLGAYFAIAAFMPDGTQRHMPRDWGHMISRANAHLTHVETLYPDTHTAISKCLHDINAFWHEDAERRAALNDAYEPAFVADFIRGSIMRSVKYIENQDNHLRVVICSDFEESSEGDHLINIENAPRPRLSHVR